MEPIQNETPACEPTDTDESKPVALKYKSYEEFLAARREKYKVMMKDPEFRKKRNERQKRYRKKNRKKLEDERKERYRKEKMAGAEQFVKKLAETTQIYEIETIKKLLNEPWV